MKFIAVLRANEISSSKYMTLRILLKRKEITSMHIKRNPCKELKTADLAVIQQMNIQTTSTITNQITCGYIVSEL